MDRIAKWTAGKFQWLVRNDVGMQQRNRKEDQEDDARDRLTNWVSSEKQMRRGPAYSQEAKNNNKRIACNRRYQI